MKNNDVGYIQICVACCKINKENSKTLPLICPKTNMACFAIEPSYLIPNISEEMACFLSEFNENLPAKSARVPIESKYIDKNFIDTRCAAFDDLLKQGNKTVLTMDAY